MKVRERARSRQEMKKKIKPNKLRKWARRLTNEFCAAKHKPKKKKGEQSESENESSKMIKIERESYKFYKTNNKCFPRHIF